MQEFWNKYEPWLNKYIQLIIFGSCTIGMFFVESATAGKVGILIGTALFVAEAVNIRDDKR